MNWEREKRLSVATSAGLLLPVFMSKEQWTIKGKQKRPTATVSTAGIGHYRKRSNAISSTAFSTSPLLPRVFYKSTVATRVCWSLPILRGSVSADFIVLKRSGGGSRRKKGTGYTHKKIVNPNLNIPHLQKLLAFAWHNRLLLDRQVCTVSWYSHFSRAA